MLTYPHEFVRRNFICALVWEADFSAWNRRKAARAAIRTHTRQHHPRRSCKVVCLRKRNVLPRAVFRQQNGGACGPRRPYCWIFFQFLWARRVICKANKAHLHTLWIWWPLESMTHCPRLWWSWILVCDLLSGTANVPCHPKIVSKKRRPLITVVYLQSARSKNPSRHLRLHSRYGWFVCG